MFVYGENHCLLCEYYTEQMLFGFCFFVFLIKELSEKFCSKLWEVMINMLNEVAAILYYC